MRSMRRDTDKNLTFLFKYPDHKTSGRADMACSERHEGANVPTVRTASRRAANTKRQKYHRPMPQMDHSLMKLHGKQYFKGQNARDGLMRGTYRRQAESPFRTGSNGRGLSEGPRFWWARWFTVTAVRAPAPHPKQLNWFCIRKIDL